MSEMNDYKDSGNSSDMNSKEKKVFIKEKIEPPKRKRKRVLMALVLLCAGVIFGLIASLTFVLSTPWIRKVTNRETTEAVESVTIPKDESDIAETKESKETMEVYLDEELLRETVENQVDAYLATLDSGELAGNYDCRTLIREVQKQISSGMVTVTSSQGGKDLFENEFTHSDETFGLVLAKTSKKALILTESSYVDNENEVYILLNNKQKVAADLLGADESLGLAVLSIKKADMPEHIWEGLEEVTLGNSYRMKTGDIVIALGKPMGYCGSANSGIISYIDEQQEMDMNLQLFQTDMTCTSDASGVLLDSEGKIMGWITQAYNSGSLSNLMAAISISDLKGWIEALSNGRQLACLGIQMQEIGLIMSEEYEIPQGLYITSCINDGPAYLAGLQNGDIIISVDGKSTVTERELQQLMLSLEPETTVNVVVMRQGRDGYVETTCPVELGNR